MIYQMVRPIDMGQETYDEFMHFKFFTPEGFNDRNGLPLMYVGHPLYCPLYSEGNLIIKDIPNDRNETPDTTT